MKNNFKIFISIVLIIFTPLKLKAKEEDHKNNELKNFAINIPKEINQKSHISKNISRFLNLLASNSKKNSDAPKEDFNIEIISDVQFSEGNKFYAEGNVLAKSKNLLLEADELIYDSKSKIILIKGNIIFSGGDQFLTASDVRYDFLNKTGYILNAYGTLNFENLGSINKKSGKNAPNKLSDNYEISNVILNSSSLIGIDGFSFNKEDKSLIKRLSSQKLKLDLNEMQKWRFKTNKIDIDNNIWFSNKLFLTNDPFNDPQLSIENNNFKSINDEGDILIKSKWSNLILENYLKLPIGPRRIKIGEKNNFRWGIGYDNNSNDGLFLTRNFDPINISSENNQLNIKKVFNLQRFIIGKTKSYSAENESILAEKVEQEASELDFFGLEIDYLNNFKGLNFSSNFKLNSLDLEKLKKSINVKSSLSKTLYEEKEINSEKISNFSLFGIYREKIWNGSLGEKEILSAYGAKIQKNNIWIKNNINKSSIIAAVYGEYEANGTINSSETISQKRLNIFLERNHLYPLWRPKINNYINRDFIYTPSVIPYGLNFYAQAKIDLYRYQDKSFQNLYTFRGGPELTLGNFKNKFLDYTKLSIYPKTTIASGKSPFEFDQSVDNHSVELIAKQQIIGPIAIQYSTEYNLDLNSTKFHEFFNTKYEISWNRRAYNINIFYNSDEKSGGINFKINSFNFNGLGKKF